MSNSQTVTMDSNTSFRDLLRKFRQEEATSSSFMLGFIPSEEDLTSSSDSSPFWWECNSETDEDGDSSTSFSSSTSTSSRGSDSDKKQYDTSHWLACQDQDNASLGCSSSDEDSYEASISSASSVCSDEDGKYFIEEAEDEGEVSFDEGEKYLVALGWWKVYRSGWWELSNGAKTHFEESYVDYRFATHLPPIPEEDSVDSP